METPVDRPPALRRRETWALVVLTLGAYTGPIGWIAGGVLTLQSRRWHVRHKVAAAFLPVVSLAALVPGVLIAGQIGCDDERGLPTSCDPGPPPIVGWFLAVLVLVVLLELLVPLVRAARKPENQVP